MELQDRLQRQGQFLFRWRSYVPLLILALMILAMWRFPAPPPCDPDIYSWVCLLVSLLGQVVRCDVVGHTPDGTSGRNTTVQVASRLNTLGMYSVVRHPLYWGNFMMWLGLAMLPHIWWLTLAVAAAFWIFYERIMLREEAFLREQFGADFTAWAAATPAFWPSFRQWKPWDLPFSWRNVLRREFSGFFALVAVFLLLLALRALFAGQCLHAGCGTRVALLAGVLAYATLFALRRWTRVLHDQPR